ncbi:MAG: hypothetical protein J5552_07640 [Prevotella sp.]|nr:hypothetical protein [Prevotella sp.]
MKKVFFMALAVAAMTFTACGNKNNAPANGEAAENDTKTNSYVVYENENYGYSVEVPAWMTRHDPQIGAESGTIFLNNPDELFDLNRIETYGSDNGYVGDPFTPETVKKRFDLDMETRTDAIDVVLSDSDYYYTIPGEAHKTVTREVFKGMKLVSVTIDYDDDMADKLGGDVAKHILESIKIK